METSEFPYYECAFSEFNKVQSTVVPFLDQDVNLVISFEAATGKTLLAECAFSYHLSTDSTSKVVYVSPFRSLTAEKYDSWSVNFQFAQHGLAIGTGDFVCKASDYEKNRLLLLTAESLDAKSRNKGHWDWIRKIVCVVFDEAHLIGQEGRGGNIEAVIMRLTKLNPCARIILLSATMSNAIELAKWIKSLNGKKTKCFTSSWKPVETEYEYHTYDDSSGSSETEKIRKVMEVVESKHGYGEKVVVFVHSKSTGRELVKLLRQRGYVSAFHNASLSHNNRMKIEKMFNNPTSGLDIIVSTSTLSTGVNVGE